MSLATMTNEQCSALTDSFVTKASRCSDPTATHDETIRAAVGIAVADCSLIAAGIVSIDEVSAWFTDDGEHNEDRRMADLERDEIT